MLLKSTRMKPFPDFREIDADHPEIRDMVQKRCIGTLEHHRIDI